MYFFASRSICSTAPSVVTSSTRPLTMASRQAFFGSTTLTATRGSRRMFFSFWLPSIVLIRTCSPSVSTHTWVIWGEPSGMSVASWQKAGSPSNFRNPDEMACGKTPPLDSNTMTEGYSILLSPTQPPGQYRRLRSPDARLSPSVYEFEAPRQQHQHPELWVFRLAPDPGRVVADGLRRMHKHLPRPAFAIGRVVP